MNGDSHIALKETLRSHRVCVLIPTYNNSGTLASVIESVLEYCSDVIVVNDGSTDNTDSILRQFKGKIDVVSYTRNRGKGYALKTGFRQAMSRGFDYAITLDSDGQHYASDLPAFAQAVIEHPGALIVGERDLSAVDINGKSSFANKFSNFWFAVQTLRRLNDTQTGYRAYPLKHLSGLGILTSRYEAELELLVFAAWKGVEIVSIPINVYYPERDKRVSHFRPGRDFARISLLNTCLCLGAIVYGGPRMAWNAVSKKRIFNKEFEFFTRKKGEKKAAATTLGRIMKAVWGATALWVIVGFWFMPLTKLTFGIGRVTENKRLRFHRRMQKAMRFLAKVFPDCPVLYENPSEENFEKPAVIICNHQSHLDLPVMISIHPKLIILTNDWVWNSPVYGNVIHKAEYLPVSQGMDSILPQLKDLRDRGYSIVIYPEGTRSETGKIQRFHQGAFYVARELGMDIVPCVLHGASYYLPKHDPLFRKGPITMRIMPRVGRESLDNEESLRLQASVLRKMIIAEYEAIARRVETAEYFKSLVHYKYVHRGWRITSQYKREIRGLKRYAGTIENIPGNVKRVRIINAGIGVYPLLFALINGNVETVGYEETLRDYQTAVATAKLPENLKYVHAVWETDYDGDDFDLTIVLNPTEKDRERFAYMNPIFVNTEK